MVQSSAQFAVLNAPGPATGYRLAWHDEFDGNSVDSQKWRMVGNKRENAQQTPDAIDVSNSIVTISTYTDSGTHYTGWLDTNRNPGCKFTFGYIEARIRFVNAPGQWSAFWLMSNNNRAYTPPNPALGVEIDIIEHRAVEANNSRDLSNRYSSAVHWNGYGAERKSIGSGVRALPTGESFSDWHTTGLLWTPTKYEFYLDGTKFWEATEGISQSDEFILLTSEIKDQAWAGDIPPDGYGPRGASTNPVMQVDWVRLWQLPPSA
jgi:beta-glucanase (GH16 family)